MRHLPCSHKAVREHELGFENGLSPETVAGRILAELAKLGEDERQATWEYVVRCVNEPGFFDRLRQRTEELRQLSEARRYDNFRGT